MSDAVYRALAIGILLAAGCVGAYHRVRAHKAGGNVSHREEGPVLFWAIRLSAAVAFAGLMAWLVEPRWMTWSGFPAPDRLRLLGLPSGILGVAWMAWTMHTLGTNLTDTVVTRERHTLVTTGPYHWVRHPYYLVVLLLMISVSLLAASWHMALWGTIVFVLLAVRSRKEEAQLAARFGEEYEAYRRRTGRFWPRLG